ncbi:hypothetical protein PRO82_000724 [Candidatus Protochlamydia amoebophila]|nr:hypothetical protein [Candidatus Protochlamydia amoebophila]
MTQFSSYSRQIRNKQKTTKTFAKAEVIRTKNVSQINLQIAWVSANNNLFTLAPL